MTASPPIQLSIPVPYVAVVTIDRPPVNAMSSGARVEFIDIMDSLQGRDDVRAIVLTATGKVFSAGADIKEKEALGASMPGAQQRADRLTRESFFCLVDSGKPVIAAVNGGALGAGFVMAAACDLIIAAESSYFAMPEIDVGQGGGASFLQRILPRATMRRMMLTGQRVPARELEQLGVLQCVPDEKLLETAIELAAVIARKSPAAVRAIRESFSTVDSLPLREGFRLEQLYTTELSHSDDAQEARRAFFEKRDPNF